MEKKPVRSRQCAHYALQQPVPKIPEKSSHRILFRSLGFVFGWAFFRPDLGFRVFSVRGTKSTILGIRLGSTHKEKGGFLLPELQEHMESRPSCMLHTLSVVLVLTCGAQVGQKSNTFFATVRVQLSTNQVLPRE